MKQRKNSMSNILQTYSIIEEIVYKGECSKFFICSASKNIQLQTKMIFVSILLVKFY